VQFRKVPLSRRRVIRALEYRVWNALSRRIIYPAVIRYFSRRYENLFTVTTDQIASWPREQGVIVDIDDPVFSRAEIEALNLPQVKAIIVTTKKAKMIFQRLGVTRPIHVIPQGVSFGQPDAHKIHEIRKRFKTDGDVTVGYHAPSLTLSADGPKRARGDQDDLDFLFAALEQARQVEPRIKLWLIGHPSKCVKGYVDRGRASWINLLGYVNLSEIPNYLAAIDVGVYPRTWSPPPARFSVKIAQFMAVGIPVVSTKLDESFILEEARCGIVCESQEDFSGTLVELARSAERRVELGKAGRMYAQAKLDWSVLAPMYREILDKEVVAVTSSYIQSGNLNDR
jgi:glycosyltransferase involved in cell wall biosynthesis